MPILSDCLLLLAMCLLVLIEDAIELARREESVLDTLLTLLLCSKPIVLIEIMVYSHISPKVDRWQFAFGSDLLRKSL